jgi:hypothetical protein
MVKNHESHAVEYQISEEQKKINTIIKLSFRYSQGGEELQAKILHWLIAQSNFSPLWLSEDTRDYTLSLHAPGRHSDLGQNPYNRPYTTATYVWNTINILMAARTETHVELVADIMASMITKDENYQQKPRPNIPLIGSYEADSPLDPHASFIRYYGIFGNTTRNKQYDKLFKQIKQQFFIYQNPSFTPPDSHISTPSNIRLLKEGWENNHPGEQFIPQTRRRKKR